MQSLSISVNRILIQISIIFSFMLFLSGSVSANPIIPWFILPIVIPIILVVNFPVNAIFLHMFLSILNIFQGKEQSHDISNIKRLKIFFVVAIQVTLAGAIIDWIMLLFFNRFEVITYAFGFIFVLLTVFLFSIVTMKTDKIIGITLSVSMGVMNLSFWGLTSLRLPYSDYYWFSVFFTYPFLYIYMVSVYQILRGKNMRDAAIEEKIERIRIANH